MKIKIIDLAKKKIKQRDIPIEWIKETLKKTSQARDCEVPNYPLIVMFQKISLKVIPVGRLHKEYIERVIKTCC